MSVVRACAVSACVSLLCLVMSYAFNLPPEAALVFEDPSGQSGSYFGFTVALRAPPYSNPWVVVGAPRANSTLESHRNLHRPGVTYSCTLPGVCEPLVLDSAGTGSYPGANGFAYKDKRDDAWIGGAMDVYDSDEGGHMVVCGPHWKNQFYNEIYLMNGICYWKPDTVPPDSDAQKLLPLIQASRQAYKESRVDPSTGKVKEYFYYAYGEAGLTVHYAENGTELLIGAPGVFDWKGVVMRYRNTNLLTSDVSKRDVSFGSMFQYPMIPNPRMTEKLENNGYFGYSLSSGKFLSGSQHTYYVSGAPRGGLYFGKVFLFDFPEYEEQPYRILTELQGSQMGEYFGAALCVPDVTGDGLPDVVVGAPQHSLPDTDGDQGCAYVFVNMDMGRLVEVGKVCGVNEAGARFGTTLAAIGDVNQDGFEDFAVGAPFEDSGRGAVYIYHGRHSGVNFRFAQRILARDVDINLSGFGMSISRGVDVDGNRYNDVAVGAFESGHVVVFRTHPVITFHSNLTTDVRKISLDATEFLVTACMSYSGRHAPLNIEAEVTLRLDASHNRVHMDVDASKDFPRMWKLRDFFPTCKSVPVQISGGIKDFTKPIDLGLHYAVVAAPLKRDTNDDRWNTFCASCPVVDPSAPTSVNIRVPFATGCADDVCRTDLRTTAYFDGVESTWTIGSRATLPLLVSVTSAGDPAYLALASISVPQQAALLRMPPLCQEDQRKDGESGLHLVCDLGNPLRSNSTASLLLEFDLRRLPATVRSLVFNISTRSVGEEQHPRDNNVTLSLATKMEADVVITGDATPDHVAYSETSDVEEVFEHVYEVQNLGPSPIPRVQISLLVPHSVTVDGKQQIAFLRAYEVQADLDSRPVHCEPVGWSWDAETVGGHEVPLEDDAGEETSVAMLTRRSTVLPGEASSPLGHLPANRTLFVNCSQTGSPCRLVKCVAGPLEAGLSRLTIRVPLRANLTALDPLMGEKNIVLISTAAKVKILDFPESVQPAEDMPDEATAHTLFLGTLPQKPVETWIIVLSVIGGVLLLLLIILALVKVGFFKRRTKEELETMKTDSLVANEAVEPSTEELPDEDA